MKAGVTKILRLMRSVVDADEAIVSYGNPFMVLVLTILSQRTRDANTELASRRLFAKYKTPKAVASAPLQELCALVKPAGFYTAKAKNIKRVSEIILERFNSRVPEDFDCLLSLPGVGRKTANCVLCYGFGKPAIAVDVHVHRISNRLGIVKTMKPEQTEHELMRVVPKKEWRGLNHTLVRFGQGICLPRAPRCPVCPLTRYCKYYKTVVRKAKNNLKTAKSSLQTF